MMRDKILRGQEKTIKGFVIAATKSGSGKTTLTLGLMAAIAKRGWRIAPFKVGPDFIDPGHHQRITGTVSRNLDGWMLSSGCNRQIFNRAACNADVAVVEGVMGLFDGYDGQSEAGSTAQMAKWLNLPVVLVVDAKSMARSAAALVQGFENFDPDLTFAGVIFNNTGSPRHLDHLRQSLEGHVRMPFLGGMPRNAEITIPERHLGLVTDADHPLSGRHVKKMIQWIEAHLDMDRLMACLPDMPGPACALSRQAEISCSESVRIGVARDHAFCFYYQDNLDLLEHAGAELVYFSPVTDRHLPDDLSGIYFGGGYPELCAEPLAGNREMRKAVRGMSEKGMPIYAECGGFMYLCSEIRTKGITYPMCGCFPYATEMNTRFAALGYREVRLAQDTIIGKKGDVIRGHEFHYSKISDQPAPCNPHPVYHLSSRQHLLEQTEGYATRHTLGSYCHLHFGSCPDAARHFVKTCRAYRQLQKKGSI